MLIHVITGRESFDGHGNVKVSAFCRIEPGDRELDIGFMSRDRSNPVTQQGAQDRTFACPHNINHGYWEDTRYEVPEGSLVKLVISKLDRGILRYIHLMCLLRENAAMRRIRIPFTGHPDAAITAGVFEGRFDLIWPNWFASIGITGIRPIEHRYFSIETMRNAGITITELDKEKSTYMPPELLAILGGRKPESPTTNVVKRVTPRVLLLRKKDDA